MESVLKQKSFDFSVAILKIVMKLQEEFKEFNLTNQIIRSGTAIGALVREAEYAESKKDFIHKMYIALKEANETQYWLLLLKEIKYHSSRDFTYLNNVCRELIAMLISTIKTSKRGMKNTEF